jgi:hypothetical protein
MQPAQNACPAHRGRQRRCCARTTAVAILIASAGTAAAVQTKSAPAAGDTQNGGVDTPASLLRPMAEGQLPVASLAARSMDAESADLDGDGDLDIIVAIEGAPNVLLLNDGRGNFDDLSGLLPKRNLDTEDIAIADFNGDGVPDVVLVSEDTEDNEYLRGIAGGGFADWSASFPVTGVSNAVIAADLDGDGDQDLFIGNNGQNFLLFNDGAGNFTDATETNLPDVFDITQDVEAGDVDGDGDLDIVIGNEDRNRLLINDGAGVFTDETTERLTFRDAPEVTREADFGDVDGDGDLDLLFSNTPWAPGADPRDRLLVNDGTGVFVDQSESRLPSTGGISVDSDFVDLDGDGDLDIVSARFLPGAVAVLINDGTGRFADMTSHWVPPGQPGQGVDIEAADFDGNGAIDLYVCHYVVGPDQLLLGRAPGGGE